MRYFTADFTTFFKQLAAHNHRDWFQENKKIYDEEVKKPFYQLTADLIKELSKTDSELADLQVKDAVFRINRDIRFSKDKTPYKLSVSAVFAPLGKKDYNNPGLFFSFGPGSSHIGGGSWKPDKEQLYAIRKAIANQPQKVKQLLADNEFNRFYSSGILGEQNKRLPQEFMAAASEQPLLFNKQFYYVADYEEENFPERTDLLDVILQHHKAAQSWNLFLKEAVR